MAALTKIKVRRGSTSAWADSGVIPLESGELGFNTDTGKLKIGDGSSSFASLLAKADVADAATNISNGSAGALVYQSGSGATAFLSGSTNGYVLQYDSGTNAPKWVNPTTLPTSSATNADYVGVTDDSSSTTGYISWVGATSGYAATKITSTKLRVNPSTGVITANGFVGPVTGTASSATKLATTRNINGVAFDGQSDITILAASPYALTIGTGLNGGSFTGSSAVTISAKLTDSTSTTDSTTAASATAVKSAYDLANAALPKSGGTMTGTLAMGSNNITGTGVIQATTFNGALNGNATTATTLQTSRTINGVGFDGSAAITIKASTTNTLGLGANLVFSSGTTWDGGTAGITIGLNPILTSVTSINGTSISNFITSSTTSLPNVTSINGTNVSSFLTSVPSTLTGITSVNGVSVPASGTAGSLLSNYAYVLGSTTSFTNNTQNSNVTKAALGKNISLAANTTYLFEYMIEVSHNTDFSGTIKFGFTSPSDAVIATDFSYRISGTPTFGYWEDAPAASSGVTLQTNTATVQTSIIRGTGVIRMITAGSVGPAFYLLTANNPDSVASFTTQANSYIKLQPIGGTGTISIGSWA